MTVADWVSKARAFLEEREVPEAEANASLLMGEVLKLKRPEVLLQGGRELSEKQAHRFWTHVKERGRRIPLAYILGSQPFLGLEMEVSPDVLVPRPETEEVAAAAIALLEPRETEDLHLLEIGTGTGCIAIALSVRFPRAMVYATELSPAALRLAERNAAAHHRLRQIRFVKEDLFKPEGSRRGWADLVISNPPYIPSAEVARLEPEVRREPSLALDGGKDGLDAIRSIVASAPATLKAGGWLVLEIGEGQGPAVRRLLDDNAFQETAVRQDMQGHDRIAVGRRE